MAKTPITSLPVHNSTATTSKTVQQLRNPDGVFAPVYFEAEAEPIQMLDTRDIANGSWRGNNNRRIGGKLEKRPSVAHVTSDFRDRRVHEGTRGRYRTMLDENGFELFIVHTNAAAHVTRIEGDGRFSRDGYTQSVLNKSFALGRIDVNAGCLVRQLKAGAVNSAKILVRELVSQKAHVCAKDAKTCPHLELEREARQARNRERMDALEATHKSADQARHEQMVRVASGASAEALANALAMLLAKQAQPTQPTTEAEKPRTKKGA